MRRIAVTLAVSVVVAGCGLLPAPSHDAGPAGAMAHMSYDLGWTGCPGGQPPGVWITGVITPNDGGVTAIRRAGA